MFKDYYVISFTCSPVILANTLSTNQLISNPSLGYDLQYRVHVPANLEQSKKYKTLYVVDGQSFLFNGKLHEVITPNISNNNIEPIISVFIDSRDPHRNEQFMCNPKYAAFFINELLPQIQRDYPSSKKREDNVIMGVSFGGLNAACFGLMIDDYFGGLAMFSPANTEMLKVIRKSYNKAKPQSARVFINFGTKNDNILAGRRFKESLEKLNFDVHYFENNEGHNWKNWQPLLDDMLNVFFVRNKN
ncbi:Enterochelin esterase [Pseudoalteromonas sp. P1-9]|uniref:alpha/beta hydrolase n=1 Tax=Pseudoalteromonas sp. P1-9 TaxID=1710354 RepID=UPI0006D63782|nr:alpha/beta hydrolase-fold protein [Pseudoalteromonas sp. P1-9]KPV95880.1 Enterochelin esterase [Pseudoalteromonas sp. P1-9]